MADLPKPKRTWKLKAIEGFIAGNVWEKPLKKYLEVLDYDAFKNYQPGIKALTTFVAIKELDNITIDITFKF